MVEKQPIPHPEQVQPLTLTLSEETQRGLLDTLENSLHSDTHSEVERGYTSEIIARVNGVRQIYTQLARNLQKEIDPLSALYLGVTDLLPPGQLETWTTQPVRDPQDQHVKRYAQYFLDKQSQQE